MYQRTSLFIGLLLTLASILPAHAAEPRQAERGIMIRVAQLYIAPGEGSAKLAQVQPGREVAILEKSNNWLHVFATLSGQRADRPVTEEDDSGEPADRREVTGWILDKGVVRASTPNGDQILFGAGADAEADASRAHGRKGAANDAFYLYFHTQEYFPNSPLGGEALYRAADIKWQLDRADVMTRPSARMKEAYLREGMD